MHKTQKKLQVKIWDPSLRGSELRATLKGHTRFSLIKFLMPVWLSTSLYE